ncbi:uncharacterized protein VTP21DRAFT_3844 [Calcarisporiella thermophila]|uniref:uncharacterized protein n=1 Tax=Calcarisporiella thermophila TaxID=911321 RepID=UPI003742F080
MGCSEYALALLESPGMSLCTYEKVVRIAYARLGGPQKENEDPSSEAYVQQQAKAPAQGDQSVQTRTFSSTASPVSADRRMPSNFPRHARPELGRWRAEEHFRVFGPGFSLGYV